MNREHIFILLSAICLFFSCTYDIDYSDSLPKDKMVVTSFIEADSTISFHIYKSAPIGYYEDDNSSFWTNDKSSKSTSSSLYTLTKATATLYANGQEKESLGEANNGTAYSFTYRPKKNEDIKLKINYSSFPSLEGVANLNLSSPKVDSSLAYATKKIDDDGNISYACVLYIEIPDNGAENYYQLSTNLKETKSNSPIYLKDASVIYENYQDVFTQSASSLSGGNANRYGVFSNKAFRGKKYILRLSLYSCKSYYGKSAKTALAHIKGNIYLSKIDKGAYNYLFSLNQYLNRSPLNSEPIIIMNNISGGYGFIGAKSTIFVGQIDVKLNRNDSYA